MVARVPSKSYRQGGAWVTPVKRWYRKNSQWVPTPPAPTYYVATTGSDGNPGTEAQPWGTVNYAVQQLTAGDVLMVRGGTYTERIQSPTINIGSYYDRITMRAYPGETPIIQGLFWMTTPSYWIFDGINVTWDDATGSAGEHMVKMTNGTRWIFRNAEVWGAKSYAAFLIAGDASYWRVTGCYMHDTYLSNGTNQDHLLYTNSTGLGGMIDHNLLHTSPNGRAIKVGPPSQGSGDTNELEIAYNSMYDNLGPSNVQLAWEVYNTVIHHNIMDKPAVNRSAVTGFQMKSGGGPNIVKDNVYWDAVAVTDLSVDADTGIQCIFDGGGNFLADPQWSNITPTPTADMAATNPAVVGYGHTTPVDDAAVQVAQMAASATVETKAVQVSSLAVDAQIVPVWAEDFELFAADSQIDSSFNGGFDVYCRSVDGSKVMSVEPAGTAAAYIYNNVTLTNAFLYKFDFYLTVWPTGLQQIVWSETTGDLPRLYLDNSPQGLFGRVASTAETALISISLNTWYSIEFSHDGTTTSLSVTPRAGGATVTETAGPDNTLYSLTKVRFGHRYGNLSDRFYIDNIEVWE